MASEPVDAAAAWERRTLLLGASLAGLAVLLGAFGAHALKPRLSVDGTVLWETAARYQMYHALTLLLAGVLLPARAPRLLLAACSLFGGGIVLFSGSLYVLALTGRRWLGALTPFGGVALLAGWVVLAAAVLRRPGRTK